MHVGHGVIQRLAPLTHQRVRLASSPSRRRLQVHLESHFRFMDADRDEKATWPQHAVRLARGRLQLCEVPLDGVKRALLDHRVEGGSLILERGHVHVYPCHTWHRSAELLPHVYEDALADVNVRDVLKSLL